MIEANPADKPLVIDILTQSFDTNKSVNYVVKQDSRRKERIRSLMEYSYDVCALFGKIFLSEDRKACALTLLPDQKKTTPQAILLDAKFAFSVTGISGIKRVLDRESQIKSGYPKIPITYLWFIGVDPAFQNKGIGTNLLKDIIRSSASRPIYLETSMADNVPFYKKFGFQVYRELAFDHTLYCMRKDLG